ncbi:hypothetical protein ACWGLE_01280 [Streptomyces sp. NPDC055897]
MTDTRTCSHVDVLYGPCELPTLHDGECLHQDQPRCGNVAPSGGHVCVLERQHDWLHADMPLAVITPNGERTVWQHADFALDQAVPLADAVRRTHRETEAEAQR